MRTYRQPTYIDIKMYALCLLPLSRPVTQNFHIHVCLMCKHYYNNNNNSPCQPKNLPHYHHVYICRAQPSTSQMSIIWITTYPMPPQFYGQYRSEFSSMAADTLASPNMRALGIKVHDLLPMILPRSRQSVDDHHYLEDYSYTGSVGRALADLLTALACSLIQ